MTTSHWLCAVALLLLMGTSAADEHLVSEQLTRLKSQALSTQRDLGLLKRELKHSREQLLVLLSVDIDTRFELVEAKLKVNGRTIKQHQFNDIEFGALRQGGNQPFANTQLAPGAYQLEIEVTAKNQNNTLFQQTEKLDFKKSEAAKVDASIHGSTLGDDALERRILLIVRAMDFGAANVGNWSGRYPINFFPH